VHESITLCKAWEESNVNEGESHTATSAVYKVSIKLRQKEIKKPRPAKPDRFDCTQKKHEP